jgi:hypothetical protein
VSLTLKVTWGCKAYIPVYDVFERFNLVGGMMIIMLALDSLALLRLTFISYSIRAGGDNIIIIVVIRISA